MALRDHPEIAATYPSQLDSNDYFTLIKGQ
jgi:hypothetical protein